MEFKCEDLPQFGLILTPPSSPEYDLGLADIQMRLGHPVAGRPPLPISLRERIVREERDTSAILINRSDKPVFALTLIWKYVEMSGRSFSSTITRGTGMFPSLLLPFGLRDDLRKLSGYWHVILPGSKRYVAESSMIGDNSDVRPPTPDELWKGGIAGGGGGSSNRTREFREVTLSIDGAFFTDGEFAGPNQGMLWENIVSEAEATMQIARIAQQRHFEGLAASVILAEIEELTGPAQDRGTARMPFRRNNAGAFRQYALTTRAGQIKRMRQQSGDERTVYVLSDWAETKLPQFRKL